MSEEALSYRKSNNNSPLAPSSNQTKNATMRFSIFTLLATGVSSAMASSVQLESRDVIGIMETYTDYECKQGRKSIDMTGMEADMQGGYPNLDMGVKAVRIGVPNECVGKWMASLF